MVLLIRSNDGNNVIRVDKMIHEETKTKKKLIKKDENGRETDKCK